MQLHKNYIIIVTLIFLLFASAQYNNTSAQEQRSNLLKDIAQLSLKLGVNISENSSNISLYQEAAKWIGTRYRRGGTSKSGVDCSGFTGNIYKAVFDKNLNRRSSDIANNITQSLKKEELETGDLVFFATSGRKGINHVGVYLKDNKFVHASCSKGVIVSSLDEPYYKKTWRKGGRMDIETQTDYFNLTENNNLNLHDISDLLVIKVATLPTNSSKSNNKSKNKKAI